MFEEVRYELRIKVINDDVRHHYESFQSHHSGDAGIDLISRANHGEASKSLIALPFQVVSINFGIQCEMLDIKTNRLVSYYLAPRSSLSNTSFMLANSIGVIDAGYRGELMAKVRNVSQEDAELPIKCYFQIIAPSLKPIRVRVVENLTETSRGSAGFGSTG